MFNPRWNNNDLLITVCIHEQSLPIIEINIVVILVERTRPHPDPPLVREEIGVVLVSIEAGPIIEVGFDEIEACVVTLRKLQRVQIRRLAVADRFDEILACARELRQYGTIHGRAAVRQARRELVLHRDVADAFVQPQVERPGQE